MNRRFFLKSIIAIVPACATLASIFTKPEPESIKGPLTKKQKEYTIAQAMKSPQGKRSLAKAMVEPIRKSINYQEIGRKILL